MLAFSGGEDERAADAAGHRGPRRPVPRSRRRGRRGRPHRCRRRLRDGRRPAAAGARRGEPDLDPPPPPGGGNGLSSHRPDARLRRRRRRPGARLGVRVRRAALCARARTSCGPRCSATGPACSSPTRRAGTVLARRMLLTGDGRASPAAHRRPRPGGKPGRRRPPAGARWLSRPGWIALRRLRGGASAARDARLRGRPLRRPHLARQGPAPRRAHLRLRPGEAPPARRSLPPQPRPTAAGSRPARDSGPGRPRWARDAPRPLAARCCGR